MSTSTEQKRGAGRPPTERDDAKAAIQIALANGPRPAGDILDLLLGQGHARNTIRRACNDLGVKRIPEGGGRGCFWQLPKGNA